MAATSTLSVAARGDVAEGAKVPEERETAPCGADRTDTVRGVQGDEVRHRRDLP
jgi:hypothetical protein